MLSVRPGIVHSRGVPWPWEDMLRPGGSGPACLTCPAVSPERRGPFMLPRHGHGSARRQNGHPMAIYPNNPPLVAG